MHHDIERYIRKQTGVTTDAQRDADRRQDLRFREPEPDLDIIYPPGIELVTGFLAADTTTVQVTTHGVCYSRYIGRAVPRLQELHALYQVTTAMTATITYAELALAYSPDPDMLPSADLDLYPIAYLDISTRVNTTGRKRSDLVSLPEINPGAHLWLQLSASGSGAALEMRAGLPDNIGLQYSRAAFRPSTSIDVPAAFTVTSTSFKDFWFGIRQVQA